MNDFDQLFNPSPRFVIYCQNVRLNYCIDVE